MMDTDVFRQQVEAAHQRLEEIQQAIHRALSKKTAPQMALLLDTARDGAGEGAKPAVLSLLFQTVSELSATLEELNTATEELSQRNEEWLAIYQGSGSHFQVTPDALIITDPQGIIREANHTAAALLNVRQDFLIGKPLTLYFASAERPSLGRLLNQLASSVETPKIEQNLQEWNVLLQPRNRELVTTAISISRVCKLEQLVGVRWRFQNITQKKQQEAEMLRKAFYDSLTNLANRSLFQERLNHAMQLFRRYPERLFAVLFIDVNKFKQINDGYGHLAGDDVLVETAARLSECIREADTAARLGGDEFAILLEEISSFQDAEKCAKRILQAFEAPISIKEQEIVVGISIGIALSSPNHQHSQDLLGEADRAMYRVKQEHCE